jgi:hypothetical protein
VPRKGQKRDPLLKCELIKIYRDVIHLQLNYIQRQYVAEHVSCCDRGQGLWRETLKEWLLNGFNPRNVPGMVKLWQDQFYTESAKFQAYIAEPDEAEVQEPDGVRDLLFP